MPAPLLLFVAIYILDLGFQKFIQTALQSDIDALPRGVGRRVNTKPISSHDNARDVLLRQYESSTRPGILPGLAGMYRIVRSY